MSWLPPDHAADGDPLESLAAVGEAHRRCALQLRTLERLAHLGSWTWDFATGRIRISEGCYGILGLAPSEEELTVEIYGGFVHPADRPAFVRGLEAMRTSEGPTAMDYRIVRPDGTVRDVHAASIHAAFDAAGVPWGLFGILQDVTEQRAIDRAKNEFMAVVSHELRTPLTAIRGPLLMFASGRVAADSPTGVQLLQLAVSNVERMTRLVDDILDMERLVTGRLCMQPAPADACELARAAADAVAERAACAGVAVGVVGEPAPVTVDRDRLVQVLTNLLDNAIAFSPSGGTVRLEVRRVGEEAWLSVSDEGPGVPESEHERIFQRFHQLEPSSVRKKQGLGLGLPISRSLVEQHGGRLWVESRPGEGATFRVALPLSRSA